MKTRILVLTLVALALLAGNVSAAQTISSDTHFAIHGIATGDGYKLATLDWQTSNPANGGKYMLIGPTSPDLTGSGCCCSYLPCIFGTP